jgi:hypothetical protein
MTAMRLRFRSFPDPGLNSCLEPCTCTGPSVNVLSMARPTITIPINNGSQTPSRPIVSGYDSPRAGSESPPPEGPQGALEAELLELTHALYNLGTTTILDVTQDAPPGGKPVGARVNDVIRALGAVDAHADGPLAGLNVPINVLREVDAGQNPEKVTREAVDRAVSENQFMNGKIRALQVRPPT